jgi:TRAP-type uncharacterized transport system substrate-binding protein
VTSVLAGCSENSSTAPSKQKAEGSIPKDDLKSAMKTVDSLKLTLVGGSAGGFWSLVGEGAGNILRQSIPNTQVSYETGNGVKSVIDVTAGKIPMGIAHNFEVKAGINGEPPFKEKVPKVTALVALYNNAGLQIVVSKDFTDKYGITSMEDIAAKKPPIRVAINQRGNLNETVNRLMFEGYGFTYDDIKKWGVTSLIKPAQI